MTVMYEAETQSAQLIRLTPSGTERSSHARISAATASLAAGRGIVLCDDIDRPRRGEIVSAADSATAQTIAFTVRHSSGFLQVAVAAERCAALGLTPQCGADDSTAQQCVSVDAADGVGTGISAADRATTARRLADADSTVEAFARPGHLVPVRVDTDRPPHGLAATALHLVTVSGHRPAAVFATVVGTDNPTDLAAGPDLTRFAKRHGLPMVAVGDVALGVAPATVFESHYELPAGPARMTVIDDERGRWTCLFIGEIDGASDVPLWGVPTEQLFAEVGARSRFPHILVAVTFHDSSDFRDHRSALVERIGTSSSALRRLLQASGLESVRVDVDMAPWADPI
ncbi:3,4-dihydroxy-2-butanone-4-phosphate synthase [Rhodococcus opacus]|uniref:3,4-dihydroxy-2-butanone-4-phosphate synthase n=1 Tax=Rhodococcus opacus TaxID=37919 RepID=UPI00294AADDC|nr:3,4-dihydroxy-2-butanone-4-phosphate synthase [Rhodococcus opacus]